MRTSNRSSIKNDYLVRKAVLKAQKVKENLLHNEPGMIFIKGTLSLLFARTLARNMNEFIAINAAQKEYFPGDLLLETGLVSFDYKNEIYPKYRVYKKLPKKDEPFGTNVTPTEARSLHINLHQRMDNHLIEVVNYEKNYQLIQGYLRYVYNTCNDNNPGNFKSSLHIQQILPNVLKKYLPDEYQNMRSDLEDSSITFDSRAFKNMPLSLNATKAIKLIILQDRLHR
jgi:hypothetical protein